MLWGSNPDARDGAPPFEGGASTYSAKHRDSPCLLVKGTDCAGVAPAYGRGSDSGLCVFCFSVLMGRSNTLTSPSGLARSFAGVLDVARLLGPLDCLGYPASNVRCRQVGNGDSRNGRVFG